MSRQTDFKAKWELECGVEITSRSASSSAVESVVCLFCRTLGKEEPKSAVSRKRKRSQKIQTFRAPWRSDKMKNHNKSMHAEKWEKYQKCSLPEKKKFFDSILECNTNLSVYKVPSAEQREITVYKENMETPQLIRRSFPVILNELENDYTAERQHPSLIERVKLLEVSVFGKFNECALRQCVGELEATHKKHRSVLDEMSRLFEF